MSRKRKSCCEDGWWQNAVDWVKEEGGEIHEVVCLSEEREPYVSTSVTKDSQLLKIPFSCLVSCKTVQSTEYGQKLMETIQTIDSGQFFSPIHDVAIALYLSRYPTANQSTKFQPYLDTLPDGSSYDNLPRRWTEDQLKLLTGSPLLERIKRQREGIQKDFDLVKRHWKEKKFTETDFPTFQAFSDRLAAVTSRAFAGFGCTSDDKEADDLKIAMVPLLDLCDHHRGKNKNKNLAYKQQSDGSVIVSSHQDIPKGDTLRITYGAQSNGRLLLNYGFGIEDNVEPDGSSNDILEFQASGKVVELKAGPKAYSFHGFANALDMFYQRTQPQALREEEGLDDFDQNEKEFDEWDMDMTGDMGAGEEDGDEEQEEEEIKKEQERSVKLCLEALAAFEKHLKSLREGYHLKGEEIKKLLSQEWSNNNCKRHAALLVKSEMRTIYFILCVIHKLQQLLEKDESSTPIAAEELLSDADNQVLAGQAKEVSAAFLAIRLPGLELKNC